MDVGVTWHGVFMASSTVYDGDIIPRWTEIGGTGNCKGFIGRGKVSDKTGIRDGVRCSASLVRLSLRRSRMAVSRRIKSISTESFVGFICDMA